MHALAKELLAFIEEQTFFKGPALLSSSHESAEVYWSIIGQRVGSKFRVSVSDSPSVFDALEYTRCFIDLKAGKLAKDGEAEVFREVAAALKVPPKGRALPFSLLSKKGDAFDHSVCAMAMNPPLLGQAGGFSGHTIDGVHAAVFADREFVVVNIDGYNEDFGRVLRREPLSKLKYLDLDVERCGFVLENGEEFVFMFEDAPRSELKSLATFCERKKLVRRKWVDLGDRFEWQPA